MTFYIQAQNPRNGEIERAIIHKYFGREKGVRFEDGMIYPEEQITKYD